MKVEKVTLKDLAEAEDRLAVGRDIEIEKVGLKELLEQRNCQTQEKKVLEDVQKTRTKKVKILKFLDSYYRKFDDRKVPTVDLLVEPLDGELAGQELILSLRKMNIQKLIALFGEDEKAWEGKKLRLFIGQVGGNETLLIDEE